MGDKSYDSRDGPSGQYYVPPLQQQYQPPGYGDTRYAPPPQNFYPPHPQAGERPSPYASPYASPAQHHAQLARYGEYDNDRYAPNPGHREHRASEAGYYYDEPPRDRRYSREEYGHGERRRASHGRSQGRHEERREGRRESEKGGGHKAEKSLGATLLGAAGGGLVGHEVAGGGLGTVIGVLAGAFGAHEFEKKHEEKKERKAKSRDREERIPQRRHSRARSRGGREDSEGYTSGDSDDSRRKSKHRHY